MNKGHVSSGLTLAPVRLKNCADRTWSVKNGRKRLEVAGLRILRSLGKASGKSRQPKAATRLLIFDYLFCKTYKRVYESPGSAA